MSKNKLKYVLFCFMSGLFLLFSAPVSASDYNINIEAIEGLNYGDKLSEAKIKGTSTIEGIFSFYNPDIVVDRVGIVEVDVIFVPYDLENHVSKKINVAVNVLPRVISVAFDSPIYKQYDGNNSIILPQHNFVGIIDDEVSIAGELVAILEGSYVGEGIDVILSGIEIVGDKKDYYILDLNNHQARVYPLVLEKQGANYTKITLDKDVYVDIGYNLRVIKEEINETVNEKYTSYLKYKYEVYSHNNALLNVAGKFNVSMELDKKYLEKERIEVYELTSEGDYKELEYSYDNGKISFCIDSTSSIVFSTRDIEWDLINFFTLIFIFSLIFIIGYSIKNSTIKGKKRY